MPLPPPDDPRRPIVLAVRMLRLVGVTLFVLALIRSAHLFPQFPYIIRALQIVPATGLIVLSAFVGMDQKWAVLASILLAMAGCILPLEYPVRILLAMSRGDVPLAILIPLALFMIVLIGLAHLMLLLVRCFAAIREASPRRRGFEPLMPAPPPIGDSNESRPDR